MVLSTMTGDQIIICGIFLVAGRDVPRGRWRHDMVAMAALLACVLAGMVPSPAVRRLCSPSCHNCRLYPHIEPGPSGSGAIDALSESILPTSPGSTMTIAAVTGLAALLSAFLNNVYNDAVDDLSVTQQNLVITPRIRSGLLGVGDGPFEDIPFRNLKRSLSVESTKVESAVMMDL